MKKAICSFILSLTVLVMSGCAGENGFRIENLAKSDIDMAAEANVRAVNELLKSLMGKLYRRNPRQLKLAPGETLNSRIAQLFGEERLEEFDELDGKGDTDAMLLAFDDDFKGDRVFALMAGLTTMMRNAYDGKEEFYLTDLLDEQKLYNSARNIEVLAWRLRARSREDGQPYLLTNSFGDKPNLSFERLFGKLISHQDIMAILVAQQNNRAINTVVHGVATTVFFPI